MLLIKYIFIIKTIICQLASITQNDNCIETFNLYENICINSPGTLIGVNIPKGYQLHFYSDPYCTGRLGRYAWGWVNKSQSPYFYQSIKVFRDYDRVYEYEGNALNYGEIGTPIEHTMPQFYHRSWNNGWYPAWSQQLVYYS